MKVFFSILIFYLFQSFNAFADVKFSDYKNYKITKKMYGPIVDFKSERTNFSNNNFSNQNLSNSNFIFADLSGTNFENSDLSNSVFRFAKISNTNFRVYLGPFKDLKSLKKAFNDMSIMNFENLEIIKQ